MPIDKLALTHIILQRHELRINAATQFIKEEYLEEHLQELEEELEIVFWFFEISSSLVKAAKQDIK